MVELFHLMLDYVVHFLYNDLSNKIFVGEVGSNQIKRQESIV